MTRNKPNSKGVNDVIADLKKYNDKKPEFIRPIARKKSIDLSKKDNIELKSNILSVTIGQLLSKNESD